MTPLRKKRLLLLAQEPRGHRCFYSQYRQLESEGLCYWMFGWAHLTEAGKEYIKENT